MPSPNKIILASAGSGKTTRIVTEAARAKDKKCLLVTYTNNSTAEFLTKARNKFGILPTNTKVDTWYGFLLHHLTRPYQNKVYSPRIAEIAMTNGLSAPYIRETDTKAHYFQSEGRIYLDKVAKFACKLIDSTDGLPLERLKKNYDHIFIDEIQDMRAYDLVLIEHLLESDIELTLVGDIRQGTYGTNPQPKYKKYAGINISKKFEEWCKSEYTTMEVQAISHRCVQGICDFADTFYPSLPTTKSLNKSSTDHDGVFAVRERDVGRYMERFEPQSLQLKTTKKIVPDSTINYGAAKGMTFDRVLLFPHKALLDVIKTDDISKLGSSDETRAKVYVGITRARQSVAVVIPNTFTPSTISIFKF